MRRTTCAGLLLLFLLLSWTVAADRIEGTVIRVADGDTLTLAVAEDSAVVTYRIRLHGIDAPEKKQPYGTEATAFLRAHTLNRTVRIDVTDTDRYGRLIGKVYRDSIYLNKALVDTGLAWHYVQYACKDSDLAEAQSSAIRNARNLWQSPSPQPPWKWRRSQKHRISQPPK